MPVRRRRPTSPSRSSFAVAVPRSPPAAWMSCVGRAEDEQALDDAAGPWRGAGLRGGRRGRGVRRGRRGRAGRRRDGRRRARGTACRRPARRAARGQQQRDEQRGDEDRDVDRGRRPHGSRTVGGTRGRAHSSSMAAGTIAGVSAAAWDTVVALRSSAQWQATRCPSCPNGRSGGSIRRAVLGVAQPLAQPAPGVEPAAGRRRRGRRDVALEHEARLPAARVRLGDRGQQRHRVRVARVAVELLDRADLDDLAEVHDADAVGEVLDDRQVVADEQVGQVEVALQVEQQVEHLALDRHVERRHGLVRDDEVGAQRERPGDADALPLAAGELVRVAAGVLAPEADELEGVLDALVARGAVVEPLGEQALADDVRHGHPRVQRPERVLEDDLHPAAERPHVVGIDVGELVAVEHDAPVGRRA